MNGGAAEGERGVRFEEDGRLLETMLSLGLEEFRNALSSIDVHMLSLVNRLP